MVMLQMRVCNLQFYTAAIVSGVFSRFWIFVFKFSDYTLLTMMPRL